MLSFFIIQFAPLILLAQVPVGEPVRIYSIERVGQFHFGAQVEPSLKEEFEAHEKSEQRTWDILYGDSPLKYPAYRLTPRHRSGPIDTLALEDAAKTLGLGELTPEVRRKVFLAYVLSQTIPQQMLAGDKFPKVRQIRMQYAKDLLYDMIYKRETRDLIVSEARAQFFLRWLVQTIRESRHLPATESLTSEHLCQFLPTERTFTLTLDWQFEREDFLPYPFLKNQPPTAVQIRKWKCDPQTAPDKLLELLYQSAKSNFEDRLKEIYPEPFEAIWFYLKRFKGFAVDFDHLPHGYLWDKYHDKDLKGWGNVFIPIPQPPKDELELMDQIFESLNLVYLNDMFKGSVVVYAHASRVDPHRFKEVDFRMAQEDFEFKQKGPPEDRPMAIELTSLKIPFEGAALEEKLEQIFPAELAKVIQKLQSQVIARSELFTAKDENSKKQAAEFLANSRQKALEELSMSLATQLGVSPQKIEWDKKISLKGDWKQIHKKISETGWESLLTQYKDSLKPGGKRSIFPFDTDLSTEVSGIRDFRIGVVLNFDFPGFYDIQLDYQNELENRRVQELRSWSFRLFLKHSAMIFPENGTSAWAQAFIHADKPMEEWVDAEEESLILGWAAVLYHHEIKSQGLPCQTKPYLYDGFIPRPKPESKSIFDPFGIF